MAGPNVHDNSRVQTLGRMALIALVIGTAVTVSATERVTISLVAAGAIGWSFVPVLQLLTGWLLLSGPVVAGGPVPGVATGPVPGSGLALDRYFATHWPWSLWILAVHGGFLMLPAIRTVGLLFVVTAAVPVIWTVRLLLVFCRDELRMSRRQSWRRVALHQAVTYLLVFGYITFAVALWPRIVGLFS
jgi:hypothetical protein